MDRTILHCDCNSFFASVETLLDPSLAEGPTAVCGDPESRHGIILAKNEKAKAFGVQTAETIWKSYASWAAADTLRTKPQLGARGTYCVKRGYVPKKFARRERHTHFLLV